MSLVSDYNLIDNEYFFDRFGLIKTSISSGNWISDIRGPSIQFSTFIAQANYMLMRKCVFLLFRSVLSEIQSTSWGWAVPSSSYLNFLFILEMAKLWKVIARYGQVMQNFAIQSDMSNRCIDMSKTCILRDRSTIMWSS